MNHQLLRKVYSILLSMTFLLFTSLTAFAQQTISGKVSDAETGEPLPGVSVLVKGTSKGTVTDINGQYRLALTEDQKTLIFSYVGYMTQEIEVGSQSTINISLAVDAAELDEVVVTALGVERETKALGYSVQEVQGEELTQARDANMVNSLAGRVAGVQVTGGNSGIGSTSLITIRGESSLIPGNNSPLFVVDGIPISNSTSSNRSEGNLEVDYGNGAMEINPDDVESISVLKGANASALYGSRGSNGVILITTKSGKGQKGLGVSVSQNMTFEEPLRIPKYQNQYGQGAGFQFEFGDGFGGGVNDNIDESWGPLLDGRLIRQHDSPRLDANGNPTGFRGGDAMVPRDIAGEEIQPTPWLAHPDNIENFFETGYTSTTNVALSGSNENGNFRVSYTHLDNEGILPNTNYKRGTFAINGSYNLTDKLSVSASVNYINSESDNRPNNSYGTENIMYLWVWFGRQIEMNSLRDYWQPGLEGVQQFNYNYNWHDNPYFTMYENTNAFDKNRIIGNVKIDYKITPELNLMVRSGTDYFDDLRVSKRAFSTQRFPRGQYREDAIFFEERNTDFLLTYSKEFNPTWSLSASVGGNRRDERNRYRRFSANELNIPGVYNFENARIPLAKTHFDSEKQVNSLYAFANISYKNILFLDITGRNDWSSTLPEGGNSYFYPSVSASAILSDMVVLPRAISFAKLRAGWAQVGNDTDPYQLRNVFNFQEPFGTTPRVTESSLIRNSNLKPEEATSFEVGLDLRFFDGRLGLDATYYTTNTRNQILRLPIDITSGYSSRVINAGKIQNRGIEVMVKTVPIQTDDFMWRSNVNFTRNRGEVKELIEGLDVYQISNNYVQALAKVGERMGDVYGTGFVTVDDPNSPFFGEVVHDQNGFARRDPTLKNLGNYNPDFMVGFQNDFTYKGINVGVLFDWRQGGVVNSRTVLIGGTSGMMDFTAESREEGIVSEGVVENGDGTYSPNTVRLSGRDYYWWRYNRGNEEVGMYDASFVKLREMRVGYTLPNRLLGKLPFRNVNLSIVGRNLALWTENEHFDPETLSFNGGTIVPGVEDMATPTSRSIGFNLSFNL